MTDRQARCVDDGQSGARRLHHDHRSNLVRGAFSAPTSLAWLPVSAPEAGLAGLCQITSNAKYHLRVISVPTGILLTWLRFAYVLRRPWSYDYCDGNSQEWQKFSACNASQHPEMGADANHVIVHHKQSLAPPLTF